MNAPLSSVETATMLAEARRHRSLGLARGLLSAFHALRQVLTTLRERRETIAQLRSLSNRELADIGLTRGSIVGAATLAIPANDASEARRAA